MKKLFLLLLGLALFAAPSFAQTVTGSLTAASASCLPTNCVSYIIPNTQPGQVGAATVQVSGTFVATLQAETTADGTNWSSIAGSPIVVSAEVTSITTTGIWQFNIAGMLGFRMRASAYVSGTAVVSIQASVASLADSSVTVSGTVSTTLCTSSTCTETVVQGTPATTGWPIVVSACSGATCYTSGVNAGATVITSGSTSTIFATTTLLKSFRCNNASASAQTITITDGNNAYFVGPLFSMTALSNTEFQANPNGSVMTSGVKASASNGVAVVCWIQGVQ